MSLSPELRALAVITTATSLMWVPYVCARMQARGLAAVANIDPGIPPEPQWALRARRAHANAIENLAVFAPLVLIAAIAGISTPLTIAAANIFVVARLAHYALFAAGVPLVRTPAFLIGACATLVIGVVLLTA
jgi:uncharacterized MAPEG superfamily protein